MKRLVLCSTAAHRAKLLSRLGLPFEAVRPDFDEADTRGLAPETLALAFAEGKARSLLPRYAGQPVLLIGADQVPEVGGELLRKAETLDEAVAQLAALSGRTHALHTGVAVLCTETGRVETSLTTVRLTMRALSAAQLRRYVEADRPLGSAGGYTFEGLGAALFSAVEGQDDSAIVGLPLLSLCALLVRFGVDPLGAP